MAGSMGSTTSASSRLLHRVQQVPTPMRRSTVKNLSFVSGNTAKVKGPEPWALPDRSAPAPLPNRGYREQLQARGRLAIERSLQAGLASACTTSAAVPLGSAYVAPAAATTCTPAVFMMYAGGQRQGAAGCSMGGMVGTIMPGAAPWEVPCAMPGAMQMQTWDCPMQASASYGQAQDMLTPMAQADGSVWYQASWSASKVPDNELLAQQLRDALPVRYED